LLFLGVLFVTISNVVGVYPPRIIRYALDIVKDNLDLYRALDGFKASTSFYQFFSYSLILFGSAVLLLAIIKGFFMFMMRQTLIVMSRKVEFDLKNEVYQHYQKLGMAFYKRNQTGDLMSRISEDVSRVRMYLGPAVLYAVNLFVLLFMVIFTMFSVNVRLSWFVLLPLPLLSLSIFYINNIIHKRSERIQKQLSNLTSIGQESFSGIRVLKSYVQEQPVLDFFKSESEEYRKVSLDLARVHAMFFPLMLLLIGSSTVLTVWIGGNEVMRGNISGGNIAEFVIYVSMLTWPVTSIGWVASLVQRASASQKRLNEFLEEDQDIFTPENAHDEKLRGQLSFRNVSFTYPDTGIEALKNVSFDVKQGERIAITGRTGSGKSTLAALIARFYDVSQGEISLDKVNIKQWNLPSLRRQLGLVQQDIFLFSETVKNNIAFGLPGASDEAIQDAAIMADVWKDIQGLPRGLSTMVGERGVTLSGGQKQRLSLARTLIKKPSLIVFDDCLSAVDAATEETVLNNIQEFTESRTSIVITHRVTSLLNFDKILVLDQGDLVEIGSHQELIALEGTYFQLYMKQLDDSQKKVG